MTSTPADGTAEPTTARTRRPRLPRARRSSAPAALSQDVPPETATSPAEPPAEPGAGPVADRDARKGPAAPSPPAETPAPDPAQSPAEAAPEAPTEAATETPAPDPAQSPAEAATEAPTEEPPAEVEPTADPEPAGAMRPRTPWWVVVGAPALAVLLYAAVRAVGVLVLAAYAPGADAELWSALTRYDGVQYRGIAANGYDLAIPMLPDGTLVPSNLAFFPLYPGLLALLDPVLPGDLVAASLALTWTSGLFAAGGLYAIGAHLRGRRTGIALAALWGVLPHAVVQSMGYTEPLFTALAAWSLWAVLRRQWLTAAVLCVLAGLTRPTGAALVAAVGLAALVAVLRRRDGWRPWLAGALAPLGWVGYVGWVGDRLGRWDGYFHVQDDAWNMAFDGGRYTVEKLGSILTEPERLAMYVTTGVLVLGLAMFLLAALDRVPWTLLVYAAVLLVIVIGGAGFYYAKARLLMPAFPLLLPVAYALGAARIRTFAVVLAVLALGSAWYGSYLLLVWTASP